MTNQSLTPEFWNKHPEVVERLKQASNLDIADHLFCDGEIPQANIMLRKPVNEDKFKRKIIQISAGYSCQFALCNDGTVWALDRSMWVIQPPIPQDGNIH